ncbi:MAG: GNAT family N-acetyltransferase [Flavobacteriales bacterium]|nr:GNAT family N-acetyltransferase [Flavobacteriales bacterium]
MKLEWIYDIATIETVRQQLVEDPHGTRLSAGYEADLLHGALVALNASAEAVGMVCLYKGGQMKYHNKRVWSLGNYEWLHDESPSQLFDFASAEAKKHGAEVLVGPLNGSTWKSYRFRDQSQEEVPLFAGEKIHESQYNEQWRSYFQQHFRYYSALDTAFNTSAILSDQEIATIQERYELRNINLNEWEAQLDALYDFNQRSFQTNFLFTEISRKSFHDQYNQVKPIIDPRFTLLAYDDDQLVGFIFAYPDFSMTESKRAILKTVARDPDPKHARLGTWLVYSLNQVLKAQGFQEVIHAFIYAKGTSTKHTQKMGISTYTTYSLYLNEL